MNFYVDIFNNAPHKNNESKIVSIHRYEKGMETPGMPEMEGKVLSGVFELDRQKFMALDGGPIFKLSEAVSLYVECEDQAEIDYFFEKLSAVTESGVCGCLKDKYGLSWQIIPKNMSELMRSNEAINTMLKMKKINIAELEKAASQT